MKINKMFLICTLIITICFAQSDVVQEPLNKSQSNTISKDTSPYSKIWDITIATHPPYAYIRFLTESEESDINTSLYAIDTSVTPAKLIYLGTLNNLGQIGLMVRLNARDSTNFLLLHHATKKIVGSDIYSNSITEHFDPYLIGNTNDAKKAGYNQTITVSLPEDSVSGIMINMKTSTKHILFTDLKDIEMYPTLLSLQPITLADWLSLKPTLEPTNTKPKYNAKRLGLQFTAVDARITAAYSQKSDYFELCDFSSTFLEFFYVTKIGIGAGISLVSYDNKLAEFTGTRIQNSSKYEDTFINSDGYDGWRWLSPSIGYYPLSIPGFSMGIISRFDWLAPRTAHPQSSSDETFAWNERCLDVAIEGNKMFDRFFKTNFKFGLEQRWIDESKPQTLSNYSEVKIPEQSSMVFYISIGAGLGFFP